MPLDKKSRGTISFSQLPGNGKTNSSSANYHMCEVCPPQRGRRERPWSALPKCLAIQCSRKHVRCELSYHDLVKTTLQSMELLFNEEKYDVVVFVRLVRYSPVPIRYLVYTGPLCLLEVKSLLDPTLSI